MQQQQIINLIKLKKENIDNGENDVLDLALKAEAARNQNDREALKAIEERISNISYGLKTEFEDLYILNSNGEKFEVSNSENMHGDTYISDNENSIIHKNILDLKPYCVY